MAAILFDKHFFFLQLLFIWTLDSVQIDGEILEPGYKCRNFLLVKLCLYFAKIMTIFA